MSRVKLVIVAFAAVVAVSAVAAGTAFAATEGWMVNGTMLSGSKKLMTTGKVTSNGKLSAAGVEIECTSPEIEGNGPEITSPNKGGATSVIFKSCEVTTGKPPCSLATKTIGTLPVLITEITLDGALAVKGKFVPEKGVGTKAVFATIKYEGASCALVGIQPVTGRVSFLASLGQDEMTWQPVLIFAAAGDLFEGSSEAKLHGEAELATENLEPWSFL